MGNNYSNYDNAGKCYADGCTCKNYQPLAAWLHKLLKQCLGYGKFIKIYVERD